MQFKNHTQHMAVVINTWVLETSLQLKYSHIHINKTLYHLNR